MPGWKVVPRELAGYQIGYRVKGIGGYSEQYTDLPMHRVADYLGTISAYEAAQALVDKLRSDIGGTAEWRIVECWE